MIPDENPEIFAKLRKRFTWICASLSRQLKIQTLFRNTITSLPPQNYRVSNKFEVTEVTIWQFVKIKTLLLRLDKQHGKHSLCSHHEFFKLFFSQIVKQQRSEFGFVSWQRIRL